jgi:DnaJ-class molecular chaperone with C-terminal Zn finger domain
MVRLLLYLVAACVLCRMLTRRWPWELAGWELRPRSARLAAETRARSLLGVGRKADRAEIIEAHRRLIAMVHPDRGGTNEQVHEANAARDTLLSALSRRPADNLE